jgi:hypothetical protein
VLIEATLLSVLERIDVFFLVSLKNEVLRRPNLSFPVNVMPVQGSRPNKLLIAWQVAEYRYSIAFDTTGKIEQVQLRCTEGGRSPFSQ